MALPLTYNWRNLTVRRFSTALTVLVVAVVIAVLTLLLGFAAGVQASVTVSGSAQNLIVLRPGATAESTSIIRNEEAQRLVQTPGLAISPEGLPLVSPEICVQTTLRRIGGGAANVAVRGVDELALRVHTEVRIVAGRAPQPGAYEAMVGRAAAQRYADLALDQQLALGRSRDRLYRIVGVFESRGSAFESEIWAPRPQIADSYARPVLSSVLLRLQDAAAAPQAIAYIASPAVDLHAQRETDYYRDLSARTRDLVALSSILVGIMAIGAAFAVANTMYAAVDGRRREIAMLRTIGYSRGAIVSAFVIESLILCAVGCALGVAAGAGLMLYWEWSGQRQDFLSDVTWTVFAYELRVTPGVVFTTLGVSFVVAVFGALAPALRASRVQIIEALRKA